MGYFIILHKIEIILIRNYVAINTYSTYYILAVNASIIGGKYMYIKEEFGKENYDQKQTQYEDEKGYDKKGYDKRPCFKPEPCCKPEHCCKPEPCCHEWKEECCCKCFTKKHFDPCCDRD